MTRSRLILLDTNVVLKLFALGIWDAVAARYHLVVAQTVLDESLFFMQDEDRVHIDWGPIVASKAVEVRAASVDEIRDFRNRFDPTYLDKLDPGESESLVLMQREPDASICSADKIVWRVLGNTGSAERGVSLEELLQRIGLQKPLADRYSKDYRQRWTQSGGQDRFMGHGRL